jgi:hypothetical protein
MGGMYVDMFLSQLVAGGCSVFAAMGPLPSPPLPTAPALAPAPLPSAFSGVGRSLKGHSPHSAAPSPVEVDDDLNVAMAMSMLSSGPAALKIAIVAPSGVRQVLQQPSPALWTVGFFHPFSTQIPPLSLRSCSFISSNRNTS